MLRGLCFVLFLLNIFLYVESVFPGYNNSYNRASPRGKQRVICNPKKVYRSFDGTCNNLVHPEYGRAGTPFRRVLDPVYDNNDGQTPRIRAKDGSYLPNPRLISTTVHTPMSHPIPAVSLMLMQWGQFLDHDFADTPFETHTESCCYDGLVTKGTIHPHVKNQGACFPIIIGPNDHHFRTISSRCMDFTRSAAVLDKNNIRQQYSANTPWIDASQVYGSSTDFANTLRSFSGGKLAVTTVSGETFLPSNSNDTCYQLEDGDFCFLSGDHRVNIYPGLAAMHTIFLRYHNKLCDRLKAVNNDWNDEQLFQEARRIVIAVTQRITYNEFLTTILGKSNAEEYDLLYGDTDYAYNSSVNPSLSNVFSTAAYRFGHSLVSNTLTIDGRIHLLGDMFLRPKYVLKSMPGVVRGVLDEKCEGSDLYYAKGITDRMFEQPRKPESGFDIVTLNIQRGRDHGLPPYNDWREKYGLARISDFDHLDNGIAQFKSVYKSVDDIDMYTGGISERPYKDAIVGELYVRLLSSQFRDLKFGDRFWFENTKDVSTPFTRDQIADISKITLAKILCDNVHGLRHIQKDVFRLKDRLHNPLVDCSTLPDINIEALWSPSTPVVG